MISATDAAQEDQVNAVQRFAHFALAALGGLPIGEADLANDVVNVIHDASAIFFR